MDIYKLLKEGASAEELVEQFAAAMEEAQARVEREKKEAAERAAQVEWDKTCRAKAREALGAALIDFAIAYGWIDKADEDTLAIVDENMEQYARLLFTGRMTKPFVMKWRW